MSKDVKAEVAFEAESDSGTSIVARAGRRPMSGAEVITVAALTVSTVVAATAVSIGIARAEALAGAPDHQTPVALLMVVALVLAGMIGLTTFAVRNRSARR